MLPECPSLHGCELSAQSSAPHQPPSIAHHEGINLHMSALQKTSIGRENENVQMVLRVPVQNGITLTTPQVVATHSLWNSPQIEAGADKQNCSYVQKRKANLDVMPLSQKTGRATKSRSCFAAESLALPNCLPISDRDYTGICWNIVDHLCLQHKFHILRCPVFWRGFDQVPK